MKNKLLSTKRLQNFSFYFVLMLLALGVVFITQGLYTISPFIAGMVLVLLTLTTPLAFMMVFDSTTATQPTTPVKSTNSAFNLSLIHI